MANYAHQDPRHMSYRRFRAYLAQAMQAEHKQVTLGNRGKQVPQAPRPFG